MVAYENDNETVKILKDKAEYFYNEGLPIHVTLINGSWKRGIIKEIRKNMFILLEFLEGRMPLLFSDILHIEKYNERGRRR